MQTEFDYRKEATEAELVRLNLEKEGTFDHIVVPKVYTDLCSKMVLVMEEIYPAIPLTQVIVKAINTAS